FGAISVTGRFGFQFSCAQTDGTCAPRTANATTRTARDEAWPNGRSCKSRLFFRFFADAVGQRAADVPGHLYRGFYAAIVTGQIGGFLVAEDAIEGACREVVDAKLEIDRGDAGNERRFLEPGDHLPADAATLVRGLDREQAQVRRRIAELHDRKADQMRFDFRYQHVGVARADRLCHPVRRPRPPPQPDLDQVARHHRALEVVGRTAESVRGAGHKQGPYR